MEQKIVDHANLDSAENPESEPSKSDHRGSHLQQVEVIVNELEHERSPLVLRGREPIESFDVEDDAQSVLFADQALRFTQGAALSRNELWGVALAREQFQSASDNLVAVYEGGFTESSSLQTALCCLHASIERQYLQHGSSEETIGLAAQMLLRVRNMNLVMTQAGNESSGIEATANQKISSALEGCRVRLSSAVSNFQNGGSLSITLSSLVEAQRSGIEAGTLLAAEIRRVENDEKYLAE